MRGGAEEARGAGRGDDGKGGDRETADDVAATYQRALRGRVSFPLHFTRPARDLVQKLLEKDITRRLGCLRVR